MDNEIKKILTEIRNHLDSISRNTGNISGGYGGTSKNTAIPSTTYGGRGSGSLFNDFFQNRYERKTAKKDAEAFEHYREEARNKISSKRWAQGKSQSEIDKLTERYAKRGVGKDQNIRAEQQAKASAGKAIGAKVGQLIGDAVKKVMDIYLAWYNFEMTTQVKYFEKNTNILKNYMQSYSKILTSGINNSIGAFSGSNLIDLVYGSSKNADNAAKVMTRMNLVKKTEELNFAMDRQKRAMELDNKYIKETAGAVAAVGGAIAMLPGIGTLAGGIIAGVSAAIAGVTEAITEYRMAQLEAATAMAQAAIRFENEMTDETLEEVSGLVEPFRNLAKQIEQTTLKLDTAIMRTVSMFDVNADMLNEHKNAMYGLNIEISEFGKTLEDFEKIQSSYIENANRNVRLSGEDANRIFATARVFGLDENTATQMYSDLNIFNMSIKDGSEMYTHMYKMANKAGVSNKKLIQEIVKNLKTAQKYDFKDGVKGMADMALWAQKTRFNMDNLGSMLDKIQAGTVEDLLSNSAQLQVLGGNAAMMSDPMAMAYEAFNDPASYAKRIQSMTASFGRFDKRTGQTSFNQAEIMQMRAIANATGESYEDIRRQVIQRRKGNEVMKVLGGNNLSREEKELLSANALWDENTKSWMVDVFNKVTGEYEKRNANTITSEDIKNIMPEDNQEQMIDIAKRQLDIQTQNLAVAQEILANETFGMYTTVEGENARRRNIQASTYEINRDKLDERLKQFSNLATRQFESEQKQIEITLSDGAKLMNDYMDVQLKSMDTFINSLGDYVRNLEDLVAQVKNSGSVNVLDAAIRKVETEGNLDTETYNAAVAKISADLRSGQINQYVDEFGNLLDKYRSGIAGAIFSAGASATYDISGSGYESEAETQKKAKNLRLYKNTDGSTSYVIDGKTYSKPDEDFASKPDSYLDTAGVYNVSSIIKDGLISNRGTKIIPVNDMAPTVVSTHVNDTVMAAKPGGPFDTLFNGIFGMVEDIHNYITGQSGTGNGNINVNVNGGIDLKGNGMNIETIRNNNILKKAIVDMIMSGMTEKTNGGKSDLWMSEFRR